MSCHQQQSCGGNVWGFGAFSELFESHLLDNEAYLWTLAHSSFIHSGEEIMLTVYRPRNEHMC